MRDPPPGAPLPPQTRILEIGWRDLLFGAALGAGIALGVWACNRVSPPPQPVPSPVPVSTVVTVTSTPALPTATPAQPTRSPGPSTSPLGPPVPTPPTHLPVVGSGGLLDATPAR